MNKKTLIIVSAAIVLIVGSFAFLSLNSDDKANQSSQTNQTPNSANRSTENSTEVAEQTDVNKETPEDTSSNQAPGKYVDYDESLVTSTPGEKLLFFHAPWCPQCRSIESDINSEGVPSGVTVFKIDYDSNQQLRQRYGVTIQTTFIKVDNDGNLIAKYVAYDQPSFDSVRQNLL